MSSPKAVTGSQSRSERRFFMAGPLRCRPAVLTVKSLIYRQIVMTGAVRGTTGDGRVTNGGPVSAADGRQGLETLAITPAEIDLGAILQADAPIPADPRCHFRDARNVHHV